MPDSATAVTTASVSVDSVSVPSVRRPAPDRPYGLLSPADLFHHATRLLLAKDMDGWIALCADDVLVEFPFAPPGYPTQLVGRAALADYLGDYTEHIDLRDIPHLKIHLTDDPNTVIAEMQATGRVVATGVPYELAYIVVLTAEHGRITRYRDYWNPLAVPASMNAAKSSPTAR
ncbi:nuclear transport factor 2 family protein [Streptomyces rimosus]|uniref:nuclear transport factor 2 family protein n=1 Tax=Streptomyces rimosus TaxID=1927 RepID=UPI0004CC28CF|nr:nuclear transport factor 2 family protein [Streptomyces rimosus]